MSLIHALYVTRVEVIKETILIKRLVSSQVTYSGDIPSHLACVGCPIGLLVC